MSVLRAFLHILWALFLTDTKQRQHEHAGALKESGKTVAAVENNGDFSVEVIVDRIADLMNEKKKKTKHGLKESLDEIGDVVEERDMIDFPNERRMLLAGVPERRDETGSLVNVGRDQTTDVPEERWGEIADVTEERRDPTTDVPREWREDISYILEEEMGEMGDVIERRGEVGDVVKGRREERGSVLDKRSSDIDVLKKANDKIGDEVEDSRADITYVQEQGMDEVADFPEEDRDETAEVVEERGEGD